MEIWWDFDNNNLYLEDVSKIVGFETIRGFNTTIIKSTNVLNVARKYYGCDTLTGMQLEN